MTMVATRFDAATLEILWSRLHGITDEMFVTIGGLVVLYDPVSAALDYGCALLDAQRRATRARGRFDAALQSGSLPTVTRDCSHARGPGCHPGDVFIGNDPWLCCGHMPDVAVMTPVFHATDASRSDQRRAPGGLWRRARLQSRPRGLREGLVLPVMKLYEAGDSVIDTSFEDHAVPTFVQPDLVLGDIDAQVGADEVAAQRVAPIARRVPARGPVGARRRAAAPVRDGDRA